jgi:Polyketide cyclase / dehydrase and lipid transport
VVHYNRELVVPVPVDEVFDYLSRFDSAAEWDPGVTWASMVTPGPVGVGSAFELEAVFLDKSVLLCYEITEFDPPRRLTLEAENRSVRSRDTMSFSPSPTGGTTLAYQADLALKGLVKLATPIFAVAFRRIGDRAATGLLTVLGGRASQPPAPNQ